MRMSKERTFQMVGAATDDDDDDDDERINFNVA